MQDLPRQLFIIVHYLNKLYIALRILSRDLTDKKSWLNTN